jgi:hypothetical protein
MDLVHVVHVDRQPQAVLASPTLAIQAQEDLVAARRNGAKRGTLFTWSAPIPALGPAKLGEPLEARVKVRHVQDRDYLMRVHRP